MKNKEQIFNNALKLHQTGNIKKAQNLYLELNKNIKNNEKLLLLIGTTYLQTEKYYTAIKYLDLSIKINPNLPDSYNNRGIALTKILNYHKSIEDYNRAISLNNNYFDAYLNKGISLKIIKKYKEAINCFEYCIKLKPDDSKIYNNLGNLYRELKEYKKAIHYFSKTIQLNKNFVEAYCSRGNLLEHYNQMELAINDYENAIKLNDELDFIYGDLMHAKMHICDWNNYEFLKENIKKKININEKVIRPFSFLSLTDDQYKHKIVSKNFSKNLFHNLPHREKIKQTNNKKIKVGYFSGDFRDHAGLHLILDVFKNHDNSKFEIYGFSHGPKKDKWTDEVKKYFYKFFDVYNLSEEEISKLSKNEGIDIAIDLRGYTKNAITKTFYYGAAPIQIVYLGYPGTMGNKYYDYIIADKQVIPLEELKNFSEKVLYLPNCYQPNQSKIHISKNNLSKKDFNLPEDSFIFGCLNASYKINPLIFDCWMKILNKCEDSVLWLLEENDKSTENLIKEAKKRGIEEHRIIFAKRVSIDVHLKRFKFIDLFLDTYPYGAHTTASEAIRMGVPIITMIGKSFASRVASSILVNAGLKELITENVNEYTTTAVGIALNKNKQKKLKNHLSNPEKTDSLFNNKKFTKNLENIFLDLIKN